MESRIGLETLHASECRRYPAAPQTSLLRKKDCDECGASNIGYRAVGTRDNLLSVASADTPSNDHCRIGVSNGSTSHVIEVDIETILRKKMITSFNFVFDRNIPLYFYNSWCFGCSIIK